MKTLKRNAPLWAKYIDKVCGKLVYSNDTHFAYVDDIHTKHDWNAQIKYTAELEQVLTL